MSEAPDALRDLDQFCGTTEYHRWSALFRNCVLTDGTHYLCEHAGCYWLADAIASHQPTLRRHKDTRLYELQFWTLKVAADHSATLICQADSGEPPAVQQNIEFTDFPLAEQRIWVAVDKSVVLMLPSEY